MSTPDAQDKKFHNSRLSPCGQQPPRRRAAVQITPAPQSPPLPPKRLATPAIAGKLMAWTAPPAPARWKPRSVRCPGSVRSRCCSPQKSCWLTPRAMSALRLRTRSARRVYAARCRCSRSRANPRSLLRDNLPLLTLVIMMALRGLEQANHPAGQLAFIATTLVGLWPVARQALRLIKSGSWFAIETLMSVAAIGALFIGATAEAAMVLLLFLIGERLEGWAASRARQG